MEKVPSQAPFTEPSLWTWLADDQTPVDVTAYYFTKHTKSGLSYWVGAPRADFQKVSSRIVSPCTKDDGEPGLGMVSGIT